MGQQPNLPEVNVYRQWKKFFKVAEPGQEGTQTGGERRTAQISDAILSQLTQDLETAREKRTIDGNTSRYAPNAWLDFVGREKHLHGYVREDLLKTVKPAEDEKVVIEIQDRNESEREDESQDDQDVGLAQACRATRVIKKAIATCQPDIVGRSHYAVDDQTMAMRGLPKALDVRAWHQISESLRKERKRVLNDRTNVWRLFTISVDPMHQRRGVGSMLLQWGCDRADRHHQECIVMASSAGLRLYERFGFEVVGEVKSGEDSFISMIRAAC